jgi:hypothetical protein
VLSKVKNIIKIGSIITYWSQWWMFTFCPRKARIFGKHTMLDLCIDITGVHLDPQDGRKKA